MIIVEPRMISVEEVRKLKEFGAKIFAYTSIIEQNKSNNSFELLEDSCFYIPEKERILNEKWNSYYMDIRSSKYVEFLNQEIENEILAKEFDGVFFDTVGDIDDSSWNEYDKLLMRRAYTDFLKKLKTNHKNLQVIQNWGLHTAHNHSSSFIDGIMWEGFSFDLLKSDQWSIDRYKEINEMNVDFYIVARRSEKIEQLKNKSTYVFIHENDIYSGV